MLTLSFPFGVASSFLLVPWACNLNLSWTRQSPFPQGSTAYCPLHHSTVCHETSLHFRPTTVTVLPTFMIQCIGFPLLPKYLLQLHYFLVKLCHWSVLLIILVFLWAWRFPAQCFHNKAHVAQAITVALLHVTSASLSSHCCFPVGSHTSCYGQKETVLPSFSPGSEELITFKNLFNDPIPRTSMHTSLRFGLWVNTWLFWIPCLLSCAMLNNQGRDKARFVHSLDTAWLGYRLSHCWTESAE